MPAGAWRRQIDAWSLDGRAVVLAPQPELRVLVGLLLASSPVPMLMGTCGDSVDADWLAGRIVDPDSKITDDMLDRIADGIADAYFARPRWQAQVIWRRGLNSWMDIDGELSGRGIDLMVLPPDRATNIVYRILMDWVREDKRAREQFVAELSTPPAAVQVRNVKVVKDVEAAHADWNALAALSAQAQGG
ncbi:hypothetical protein [Rhodococcoides kyotonense]|uniref:Uncharacterized protein n=1 Tax=Rhodococcoides kyotonense TaxID=398843 RepID=A0A239FPC5_9NOCA|nr:hypothetical protein [Rhodococcus kyotonensis]SNS58062.1 hypothetical protein SAMN05421642_103371 [Rhodococcus kyotonensis]